MTDQQPQSGELDVSSTAANRLADRFLSLLLLFEVVLVSSTWPLWSSVDQFPAVPLFRFLAFVPAFGDQCLTILMCLAAVLGAACFASDSTRKGTTARSSLLLAFLCGGALALLNQHRLQTWHWLFLLISLQAIVLPAESRVPIFRLTLATIYLFAAASRWGPDVDSGMSRQVLSVITKTVGLEQQLRNPTFLLIGCSAMTAMEFATGVLLLIPRCRRWGGVSAILMHGTLILVLSPWGLNHHAGVLVWNLFLLLAIGMLFIPGTIAPDWLAIGAGTPATRLMAAFVILFPLSAFWGWADNWLSWHVYSPRPEVVRMYVHENAVDDMPAELKLFLDPPAPLDVWHPVRIDRWSLATTSVPLYPEDRFQLAVAAQILLAFAEPTMVRIQLDAPYSAGPVEQRSLAFDADDVRLRQASFLFNGSDLRSESWAPQKRAVE